MMLVSTSGSAYWLKSMTIELTFTHTSFGEDWSYTGRHAIGHSGSHKWSHCTHHGNLFIMCIKSPGIVSGADVYIINEEMYGLNKTFETYPNAMVNYYYYNPDFDTFVVNGKVCVKSEHKCVSNNPINYGFPFGLDIKGGWCYTLNLGSWALEYHGSESLTFGLAIGYDSENTSPCCCDGTVCRCIKQYPTHIHEYAFPVIILTG
jgi:hypothetical protein